MLNLRTSKQVEIRNAISAHEKAQRNIVLRIKDFRNQYAAQASAIKYYRELLKNTP